MSPFFLMGSSCPKTKESVLCHLEQSDNLKSVIMQKLIIIGFAHIPYPTYFYFN